MITRQKEFLLDSFVLDVDEIKARYIKLGEMHYDINIPYADYMAGMNILEEGIVSAIAKRAETEELLALTFRFFKQIRAFTTKGYLNRMLEADIYDIDRYLSHVQLAFITLDIDHFKDVNDTFGYAAGGEVFKVVSLTLPGLVRSTDYCFRMGGEEFLIVLKGATRKVAVTQTEVIRKAIENLEIKFKEQSIHTTASFGVAVFGASFDLSISQMVEVSDERLYAAKKSGRNRVNSGE